LLARAGFVALPQTFAQRCHNCVIKLQGPCPGRIGKALWQWFHGPTGCGVRLDEHVGVGVSRECTGALSMGAMEADADLQPKLLSALRRIGAGAGEVAVPVVKVGCAVAIADGAAVEAAVALGECGLISAHHARSGRRAFFYAELRAPICRCSSNRRAPFGRRVPDDLPTRFSLPRTGEARSSPALGDADDAPNVHLLAPLSPDPARDVRDGHLPPGRSLAARLPHRRPIESRSSG
jgi:hypothetical protein